MYTEDGTNAEEEEEGNGEEQQVLHGAENPISLVFPPHAKVTPEVSRREGLALFIRSIQCPPEQTLFHN